MEIFVLKNLFTILFLNIYNFSEDYLQFINFFTIH